MWLRYLSRRVVGALFLVAILVVLTFLIVHLVPGDPARNILGMTATPSSVRALRHQLKLDEPLTAQFADYLGGLAHGNLGTSFVTSQPVSLMIEQRLPVTAELAGVAVAIILLVGFPTGMLVAAVQRGQRGRLLRSGFTGGASLAGAMPEYIAGTLLILLFALKLRILPAQGGTSAREIILPAIGIAFAPTAVFARLVRNETTAVLSQEYILAASSKRLPTWRFYVTHVLPNVITSTLTLGGLILVAVLGGTVVAENVFAIPGLGTAVVQSVLQSDYPAVQGILLVLGLLAIGISLMVDISLALVDPRVLVSRS